MDDISLKELKFESQTSYTLLEEIGRGGLGMIYLAARNSGGVKDYVVLKILRRLSKSDEELLRVEANLAATLHHENIVKTYGLESMPLLSLPNPFVDDLESLSYLKDYTVKSENPFRRLNFREKKDEVTGHIPTIRSSEGRILVIAMDFVDGLNLQTLHQEHLNMSILIPLKFAGFIISRVARALGYAHNYMVHKNIYPRNILVNTHGICKLSDFGVEVVAHKQQNYIAGRLSYLPPEKYLKTSIDERTDLFALGLTAYEILTGISFFNTDSGYPVQERIEKIKQRISSGIIPPSKVRKDIPEELSQIIVKMLNPSSALRYQRAITVANDLEKKYLYSKGYGPTNNSLANYLAIFESKFSVYTEDQLQNLSFLKNDSGEIQLRRKLDFESYTELGIDLMKQTNPELYEKIRGSQRIETDSLSQDIHCIKLKHLDNVIESFSVEISDLVVGSSESANIILVDEDIPAQICKISYNNSTTTLHTLSSEAEVIVNTDVVQDQRELREGDKIILGSHQFFFLKQSNVDVKQPEQVFNLQKDTDLEAFKNTTNFAVRIPANPQALATAARIIQQLLGSTNLSDMKKGVIPTAFMETLQLLKGKNENDVLNAHIIKDSVRILFRLSGFDEDGYGKLLSTFDKHRKGLIDKSSNEDDAFGISGAHETSSGDLFKSQDDMATADPLAESDDEPKQEAKTEPEEDDEEFDSDIDIDIDLDNFENPSMGGFDILAAIMIMHSFDRIEFKKYMQEIELVVQCS